MDFANHKEETKKAGLGSDFFRCQKGENKIRVLCFPEKVGTHYFEKVQGQEQPKPTTCTLEDECIYCQKKMKVSMKIQLYVLDRSDNAIKLGELPWSVFTAIGTLQKSSEYGYEEGTLPPYDLIVTKTGEGQMGTKYEVTPGRNSDPLTEDQQAELNGKKNILEIVTDRVQKAQVEQKEVAVNNFEEELHEPPKQ